MREFSRDAIAAPRGKGIRPPATMGRPGDRDTVHNNSSSAEEIAARRHGWQTRLARVVFRNARPRLRSDWPAATWQPACLPAAVLEGSHATTGSASHGRRRNQAEARPIPGDRGGVPARRQRSVRHRILAFGTGMHPRRMERGKRRLGFGRWKEDREHPSEVGRRQAGRKEGRDKRAYEYVGIGQGRRSEDKGYVSWAFQLIWRAIHVSQGVGGPKPSL